jgi:hypothetical protein
MACVFVSVVCLGRSRNEALKTVCFARAPDIPSFIVTSVFQKHPRGHDQRSVSSPGATTRLVHISTETRAAYTCLSPIPRSAHSIQPPTVQKSSRHLAAAVQALLPSAFSPSPHPKLPWCVAVPIPAVPSPASPTSVICLTDPTRAN